MKILGRMAVLAMLAMPSSASAQDKVTGTLSADVVSRYMWRGIDKGEFCIQPEASVSWQGLSLSVTGSTELRRDGQQEIDLQLQYSNYGFNVSVYDYWESGYDPNDRFFHYEKQGAHQLEANVGYTCKYGSLQAYTVFWGNDFKINGSQAYSTYLELSVPFSLGGIEWTAAAGMTPFESAGETEVVDQGGVPKLQGNYYYADGPACVMASLRATKSLDLGFSRLPVFAEFHANPYLQTATVLFGLTIDPFF